MRTLLRFLVHHEHSFAPDAWASRVLPWNPCLEQSQSMWGRFEAVWASRMVSSSLPSCDLSLDQNDHVHLLLRVPRTSFEQKLCRIDVELGPGHFSTIVSTSSPFKFLLYLIQHTRSTIAPRVMLWSTIAYPGQTGQEKEREREMERTDK